MCPIPAIKRFLHMTQTREVSSAPHPTRYWKARQKFRASGMMERQLSFFEVMWIGKRLHNRWNALRLYGLKPMQWYFRGIRILGRTAIEAHPDPAADKIGEVAVRALAQHEYSVVDLIDPFLGSGNLTYHLAQHIRPERIVASEISKEIATLTARSLLALQAEGQLDQTEILIFNDDWTEAIRHLRDVPTLVVLAPPWGSGYEDRGLDLRKTSPPVPELINQFLGRAVADLLFLIPISGGNTLIEPVVNDPRMHLIIHRPKPSSGFLLLKADSERSPDRA